MDYQIFMLTNYRSGCIDGACLANTFSDMPPAYGKQNNRIFTEIGDGAIHMLFVLSSCTWSALWVSLDEFIMSETNCSMVVLSRLSINAIAVKSKFSCDKHIFLLAK